MTILSVPSATAQEYLSCTGTRTARSDQFPSGGCLGGKAAEAGVGRLAGERDGSLCEEGAGGGEEEEGEVHFQNLVP